MQPRVTASAKVLAKVRAVYLRLVASAKMQAAKRRLSHRIKKRPPWLSWKQRPSLLSCN